MNPLSLIARLLKAGSGSITKIRSTWVGSVLFDFIVVTGVGSLYEYFSSDEEAGSQSDSAIQDALFISSLEISDFKATESVKFILKMLKRDLSPSTRLKYYAYLLAVLSTRTGQSQSLLNPEETKFVETIKTEYLTRIASGDETLDESLGRMTHRIATRLVKLGILRLQSNCSTCGTLEEVFNKLLDKLLNSESVQSISRESYNRTAGSISVSSNDIGATILGIIKNPHSNYTGKSFMINFNEFINKELVRIDVSPTNKSTEHQSENEAITVWALQGLKLYLSNEAVD